MHGTTVIRMRNGQYASKEHALIFQKFLHIHAVVLTIQTILSSSWRYQNVDSNSRLEMNFLTKIISSIFCTWIFDIEIFFKENRFSYLKSKNSKKSTDVKFTACFRPNLFATIKNKCGIFSDNAWENYFKKRKTNTEILNIVLLETTSTFFPYQISLLDYFSYPELWHRLFLTLLNQKNFTDKFWADASKWWN